MIYILEFEIEKMTKKVISNRPAFVYVMMGVFIGVARSTPSNALRTHHKESRQAAGTII